VEEKFCQSCAMPLRTEEFLGTNKDGTVSGEYCKYCYENGEYVQSCTMDEMIDFCAGPMVEHNEGMTKEGAIAAMKSFFPQLKRWKD